MILFLIILTTFFQDNSIKISDSWVRPAFENSNSAIYFQIENNSGKSDFLTGVESEIAQLTEIHETFSEGDKLMMRKIESVEIKANSKFDFKPRAHHIMLIKLKKDLKIGDKVEFTLIFKNAGKKNVVAIVKEQNSKKK
ncbi:MAG: copper chaperone PCu(A)C [Ignavibacteriaceae bacterium]|nr:copper chaperone PCu(A)C [Ignavibacteriaceae bacterium]